MTHHFVQEPEPDRDAIAVDLCDFLGNVGRDLVGPLAQVGAPEDRRRVHGLLVARFRVGDLADRAEVVVDLSELSRRRREVDIVPCVDRG